MLSKMKSLKIKFLDVIFLLISLSAICFSFISAKKSSGSSPVLLVTSPDGDYVYSLDKDAEYDVQGKIGVSKIIVKDKKAFFEDSPCQNKTCVQCAPISQNGQWIACLPNGVFIRIENKSSDVDAVAF